MLCTVFQFLGIIRFCSFILLFPFAVFLVTKTGVVFVMSFCFLGVVIFLLFPFLLDFVCSFSDC